jgi:hypothetical protein
LLCLGVLGDEDFARSVGWLANDSNSDCRAGKTNVMHVNSPMEMPTRGRTKGAVWLQSDVFKFAMSCAYCAQTSERCQLANRQGRGASTVFRLRTVGLPMVMCPFPTLPVQSSVLLEHDDRTAFAGYSRAMSAQESVPYESLRLLDGAEPGFAHEYLLRRMDDFTQWG